MKKSIALLIVLFCTAHYAFAQGGTPPGGYGPGGSGGGVTIVTTNPVTCTPGATFFNTATNQFLICPTANTPAGSAGGAPIAWLNVTMPPYNAVGDGRSVPCSTNSNTAVTSAAGFLSTDQGKEIYIYNASNGNAFTLGTVTTFTDTSDIIISGSALQTVGSNNQRCHIGTDNFTAFQTAMAALVANQVFYMPGGNYMFTDHQLLGSGGLATNIAVTVMGDGRTETQLWYPPFGTSATTTHLVNMFNNAAYVHDFSVQPGPEVATSSSNQNYLCSFTGFLAERIGCNNFLATATPTGCLSSSVDGMRLYGAESFGCAIGLYEQWKTLSVINGTFSGTIDGAKLFDFSGQLIGGSYTGGSGGAGIHNVVQGTPNAWQIMGVTAAAGTGCAYKGDTTTSVQLIGNSLGSAVGANDSGICLTTASSRAYSSKNAIYSHGTGFGYNNSGQLYVDGTDQQVQVGTAVYTGAGTVNGKSTMTGTAYSNSTASFTAVTGGSGEAFLWNVDVKDQLNLTCHLYYQAAATGGLNIEFTGPAGSTALAYGLLLPVTTGTAPISSAATAYSTSLGAVVGTAATNFEAIVSFSLVNGATAGNVTLLAASSAAVALTIQPGSYCQSQ